MLNNIGLPGLILIAVMIVPFWQLWKRTGHNPAISLLMLVPLVNVILLFVLAFKAWPIEKEGN